MGVCSVGLVPASSPIGHSRRGPGQEPQRRGVGSEVLAAIAAGLALSCGEQLSELPEGGGRRFARLLQTEGYDAWLIAWDPAADLDLHDHGGSEGAFHVVQGRLVEVHTDLDRRHALQTLRLRAGSTRLVTTGRVHRVWNPGPGEALSVHVYSPPLTSMTFYDDHPDRFLTPLRTQAVDGAPEAEAAP